MYTRTRVGTLLFRSFALRSFALIYIDLVALYKRATVSELLFIYFEKRFDQKTFFCMFLIVFHSFPTFLCQKSESLLFPFAQLLLFKDRWDRFALVALYKRALRSFAQSQKTSVSLEKPIIEFPTLNRVQILIYLLLHLTDLPQLFPSYCRSGTSELVSRN